MNSRQFFWTNILLSSNTVLFVGVAAYLFISIITYLLDINKFNLFFLYLIIGFYLFYILIKILWLPLLTFKKFKKTFSYKFLRKFDLNKTFKKKILINALVADCLFNFIQLGFIFRFLNTPESSSNLNWSHYLLLIFLINIFAGTGIVLSYLSLIIWQKISYIYRLLDKIDILTKETIDKFVIEKIQKEIERIKNNVQSYANEYKDLSLKLKAEKLTVDAGVKIASPLARDAAALWQLASSKFTRGLDYIEKNGKIVEKVSDLKNHKLENFISTKLNSQLGVKNTRGVVFNVDSSISASIVNSKEFNEFMKTNIEKFIDKSLSNKSIGDTSLSFKLANSLNNFGAIHNCDIIDMKVVNGIFHAKVIDTVEYNPNELIVLFPRDLQEGGAIENYYVIIEISVPIEKWTTKK